MSEGYFLKLLTESERKQLVRLETVADLETLCLERYADKPAINTPRVEQTYRQMWTLVGRYRGFLSQMKIKPGEKIAIALPNSEECIETFLAVATYGAIAVMIAGSGPAQVKEEACDVAGCKFAFCKETLKGITCWDPSELTLPEPVSSAALKTEEPVAAFFTGGTSGLLKCALLSNKAIMTGTYNGVFALSPVFGQRYYGLIPFSHIFGTVRNMLTCFQTGSCIRPCSDMSAIVQDMKEYKPTILVLIPALAGMLLNLAGLYGKEVFGGQLKQIVTGGAPQPTEIARVYKEKYGIDLVSGYGLTETANLVSGNTEVLEHCNSVGQLYNFQEVRIVDQEIQVRGDNIFIEYINNPAETAAAFDDGWFKTGDLGYMDEDGYLFITGRIKNLIYFTNGEKICPEQIEARVDRIPGVKASLVSMKKNAFGANMLTCEIFTEKGHPETEASIRNAVEAINSSMQEFSRVRQILFRYEDFPRTAAMKIRRPKNDA